MRLSWNCLPWLLSNISVSGRQILWRMAVVLWCAEQAIRAADPAATLPRPGVELFERRIRPVLIEQCYSCHSEKAEGGLRLDTAEGLRRGGANGPVVVPLEPGKSSLLQVMRRRHPENPPHRERALPRSTIADFDAWIRMGAPDPRALPKAVLPPQDPRQHWTFRPIASPPIPGVRQVGWPKEPLDQFILARLEKNGLAPAPPADRATWLRRVSFDLTGLPPTAEEIDAFLQDASGQAQARVVDRLLNSAHFGEHWGRQWLEQIGHVDLGALEQNAVLENAWRYRDYVIGAYNEDTPFDQFVLEQLAGDLLAPDDPAERTARLVATGFLMAGRNPAAQPSPVRLLLEVADHQIDLTTRTFLGLTVACARCHDHKSDPITMKDYYALAGIFTSTLSLADDLETRRRVAPRWREVSLATPEQLIELEDWEAKFDELKEQLREAREMQIAFPGEIDSARLAGVVVDNLAAELQGAWKESNYSTNFVDQNYVHDGDADKGKKSARFVADLPKAGLYQVLVSYTPRANRATNVPVTVTCRDGVKTVRLDQTRAPTVDKVFAPIGQFNFDSGDRNSVVIANEGTRGFVVVDAVRFVPVEKGGVPRPAEEPPETALLNYRQLEKEFLEFRRSRPVLPKAMAVEEGKIRDLRLRLQGDPDREGDLVPRGFLAFLGAPDSTLYVVTDDSSGRLELAYWLANPANPLTARVAVNRIWKQLFGLGLVDTADDFGRLGGKPSHPELLDYLARRFVEQGWSVKKLVRTLVLSSTYQMSGSAAPAMRAKDPDNQLLSRFRQRQLAPEVLRDALLAVSSGLDRTVGGPWLPTNSAPGGTIQECRRVQSGSLRRSVYLPVVRERRAEILRALQSGGQETVAEAPAGPARPRATDARIRERFLGERAWEWSEALRRAPARTDLDRITLAYRQALGRSPTREESAQAIGRLQSKGPGAGAKPGPLDVSTAWEAFCQSLLSGEEFARVE